MAEAARLAVPYPETGVVEKDTLAEQSRALADLLPERPVVVGGCCCAHVGAVTGLARRHARLGVVWLDAHGDLNTPQTSPSGNEWGMPLRALIDDGTVAQLTATWLASVWGQDPAKVPYLPLPAPQPGG